MKIGLRTLILMGLVVAASQAEGPKRIPTAEAMASVVNKVVPEYPPIAKQLHLAGDVEMEVVIEEDGKVESATPLSGNPVLTRPAADAMKRWKFRPFQENGTAVKAQTVIKIHFSN